MLLEEISLLLSPHLQYFDDYLFWSIFFGLSVLIMNLTIISKVFDGKQKLVQLFVFLLVVYNFNTKCNTNCVACGAYCVNEDWEWVWVGFSIDIYEIVYSVDGFTCERLYGNIYDWSHLEWLTLVWSAHCRTSLAWTLLYFRQLISF